MYSYLADSLFEFGVLLVLQETLLLMVVSVLETKEAFLERAGEVRSEQVSELEVL